MAVNIGPRIGIDGEAQFRKEISNLIQQQKTLASELKAVTSAFDKNDKSEESLTAQTKVLSQQIQVQQQRIEKLSQGLSESAKQFGETDSRTLKWKQSVNEATAELNRMKSQLSGLENSVDDVGDAMDDAGNSASSFGSILGAGALIEGAKAIVGAFGDIVESTKEYRKIMASLETSSQAAGYTTEQTTETFRQLYGVLGDDQTAATATANLQAVGLSQEQLTGLTDAAIGAWAKYGDSIPIDSLSEAINETIKTGTVTGTFADVLNWAGQSEDDFNAKLAEASNESERANMVLQAMVDQGLAQAGEAWQQNNQDIVAANEAQADLNESLGELSKILSPVANFVAQLAADLVGKLVELAGAVSEAVSSGNPLVAVFAGLATGATVLAVALNFSAIVQTLSTALGALKVAVMGVSAAMAANPIGLVVSLIAGLVAAITVLWTTNEDFQNAVIEIGKQIGEFVSNLVDAVVKFFTKTIPDAFNAVIDFVKNNWQGLLLLLVNPFAGAFKLLYDNCEGFRNTIDNLVRNIKQAFENMKNGISNTVGNIRDAIVNGIQQAVDFITELPSRAVGWGRDFIQGLADGIWGMIGSVVDAVSNVASTITSYLHFSRPDIGPLRQYEEWMPDMLNGMAKGIRENAWQLEDALNAATSNLQTNVNVASLPASGGMNMGAVNITINAAPGMDENALAEAVAYKLQHMYERRRAVW